MSSSTKVGVSVVIFAALAFTMFFFFNNSGLFSHNYTFDVLFDDASNVDKGAAVTLAGVQIGEVSKVTLTPAGKADLLLKIQSKYSIARGSQFSIVTPLLGSTAVVTITTPQAVRIHPDGYIKADEANLVGMSTPDVNSALAKSDALIQQLSVTVKKADALLDGATGLVGNKKLQGNLQQTVSNINQASANGLKLTNQLQRILLVDNAQIQGLLTQTGHGAQTALGNVTQTTAELRDLAKNNKESLNEIVANLRDTTASVAGLTSSASDLLKGNDVKKITGNLSATVANLKSTTDKLDAITGNFQKLSSDPGIQNDLKDTLHNIRDTTAESKLLLQRLSHLAGVKEPAVVVAPGVGVAIIPTTGAAPVKQAAPQLSAPLFLPRVDLIQNTRDDHFRMDLDGFVPLKGPKVPPGTFARAGIYGLGDTNKVNLQMGRSFGRKSLLDARAGLYASKLSVGADFNLGGRESVSLDAYDPNLYHLDVRGLLMVDRTLGLIIGAEDITRHSGAIVGLEYRSSK